MQDTAHDLVKLKGSELELEASYDGVRHSDAEGMAKAEKEWSSIH